MTPLRRVLAGKREDLLGDYLAHAETVTISHHPVVPACRDPFDRAFLELAVVGRADALMTRDQDLLVLARDFEISIVTPVETRSLVARRPTA